MNFRQYSDSLPATPAEDWVFCPDCKAAPRIVPTTFNGFSAWAYKQERMVGRDSRGQLCTRAVWYRHVTQRCHACR